jgi:hypothetical protein
VLWVHIDDEVGRMTASDVRTERHVGHYDAILTFTVTSEFRLTVEGTSVTAIFRNGNGHITGGAGSDALSECTAPPGRSTCTEELNNPLPSDTVDSRTEVYLGGQ